MSAQDHSHKGKKGVTYHRDGDGIYQLVDNAMTPILNMALSETLDRLSLIIINCRFLAIWVLLRVSTLG